MKAFLMLMALLAAVSARAEVIVKRDWRAKRTVTITGNYKSEAPQAMGALHQVQQITVVIPADLRTVSGSKTYPIEGLNEEKGTLTLNWTFTRL